MDKEKVAKEFVNLMEKSDTKKNNVVDLNSAILNDLKDDLISDNIKKEYRKVSKKVGNVKSAIIYILENEIKLTTTQKIKGEKLIARITEVRKKGIESPIHKISRDREWAKYQFRDGSESTLENYNEVNTSIFERNIWNKTELLEDIYDDCKGYIISIKKELWKRPEELKLSIPTIGEVLVTTSDKDV